MLRWTGSPELIDGAVTHQLENEPSVYMGLSMNPGTFFRNWQLIGTPVVAELSRQSRKLLKWLMAPVGGTTSENC